MRIINDFPIILTSDAGWLRTHLKNLKTTKGAVWLLPPDAVLLVPPTNETQEVDLKDLLPKERE